MWPSKFNSVFCRSLLKSSVFYADIVTKQQRCLSTKMGRVKFYNRDKGYGFIVADAAPNVDVFVHRKHIQCDPPLPEDFTSIRWPYLRKAERVCFETIPKEDGREEAIKVSWANGQSIPPERTNYLGKAHEQIKGKFGESVYDLLQAANLGDKDLLKEIRAAYDSALTQIQNSEAFMRKLGMDPSQLPTIKADTGSGRFIFAKDSVAVSSMSEGSTVAAGNNAEKDTTTAVGEGNDAVKDTSSAEGDVADAVQDTTTAEVDVTEAKLQPHSLDAK